MSNSDLVMVINSRIINSKKVINSQNGIQNPELSIVRKTLRKFHQLLYIFSYNYLHITATVSCKLRPHPRTQLMPHPWTQGFYLTHIYSYLSRNESIDAVLPSGVVTWFLCYFDGRKYFLGCEISLNPRMKVIRTLYPPKSWMLIGTVSPFHLLWAFGVLA